MFSCPLLAFWYGFVRQGLYVVIFFSHFFLWGRSQITWCSKGGEMREREEKSIFINLILSSKLRNLWTVPYQIKSFLPQPVSKNVHWNTEKNKVSQSSFENLEKKIIKKCHKTLYLKKIKYFHLRKHKIPYKNSFANKNLISYSFSNLFFFAKHSSSLKPTNIAINSTNFSPNLF